MPTLKQNIVANYIGGTWTILMGIAFVPVYIAYLGVEAYGLIGVYVTMQAWIALLDMGMTPTLNREMARYKVGEHDNLSARRLLRTLECVYIAVVAIVIIGSFLAASVIAGSWLTIEKLSVDAVETAIVLMGLIIAVRWFMTLYRGAIMGLQEQVWLNKIAVVFATVRGLGVIPLIIFISPTIEAFFLFQAAVAVAELAVIASKTYRLIPRTEQKVGFDLHALRRVWDFAFGVFSVNVLATVLMQSDKVFISLMLPLRYLGFYTLATSVCSALTSLAAPINNGAYPRMTELIAKKEQALLVQTYRKSTQMLAVIVIPAGIVISVYSAELLMLWTQNEATAMASAGVLSVYAIGTVLNGLMSLPYTLQLSYGYTKLMSTLNLVMVLALVPLMYWGIAKFGMIGAAYVWVLLNTIYIVVGVPLMHRKYLRREKLHWYLHSLAAPAISVVAVCVGLRWYIGQPQFSSQIENLIVLAGISFVAVVVAIVSTPFGRQKLSEVRS